jgi:hypothetical protein
MLFEGQIMLPLAIIVLVEQVGELGLDGLVIAIPRPRPTRTFAALPFDRVPDVGAILPCSEALTQQGSPAFAVVDLVVRDQTIDRLSHERGTRTAALLGHPVKLLEALIPERDECTTGHAKLISSRDINHQSFS